MRALRIPVPTGNVVGVVGIVVGLIALLSAGKGLPVYMNLTSLLIAWLSFWYFSHCLAHYAVGRVVGAKFSHYVVGPSSIIRLNLPFVTTIGKLLPTLGLRIDHGAFKDLSASRRAAVYASGALASMLAPLITVASLLSKSLTELILIFAAITLANVLFTIYYSPKAGDFKRAMDTLRAG